MKRIHAGALLIALLLASTISAESLSTPFNSNNGQSGNMFDVEATGGNAVTITGIEVNIDAGVGQTIEVYTIAGTMVGSETNAGAWNLEGSAGGVISAGLNIPTSVPLVLAIPIAANDRIGMYVTCANTTAMNYTNGGTVGNVWASDANITIYEGVGKSYPFGGTFTTRNWNGTIIYELSSSAAPAASPLALGLLIALLGGAFVLVGRKTA